VAGAPTQLSLLTIGPLRSLTTMRIHIPNVLRRNTETWRIAMRSCSSAAVWGDGTRQNPRSSIGAGKYKRAAFPRRVRRSPEPLVSNRHAPALDRQPHCFRAGRPAPQVVFLPRLFIATSTGMSFGTHVRHAVRPSSRVPGPQHPHRFVRGHSFPERTRRFTKRAAKLVIEDKYAQERELPSRSHDSSTLQPSPCHHVDSDSRAGPPHRIGSSWIQEHGGAR